MNPDAPLQEDGRWLSMEEMTQSLGVRQEDGPVWMSRKGLPGCEMGRSGNSERNEVDAWVLARGASEDVADPGT